MIWPMVIGPLFGLSVLSFAHQLISMRRPSLASRLQQNLPGFRAKRSSPQQTLSSLLVHLRHVYLRTLSEATMARDRQRRMVFELPDYLDFLAVATSAGIGFHESLSLVNRRTKGVLAEEFAQTIAALDMGSTIEVELPALSRRLGQRQIEEFSNKVLLAHRRGTPLAKSLRDQSRAARLEIRNQLLSQAGKNETRMLIPLVFLILPVTILFAIYPSLQLLNLNYF